MARYDDFINRRTMSGRCDVTPLFANGGAFSELINDLIEPFGDTTIDAVAGIDALGFILGAAIATRLQIGFIPIRKAGKLPVAADRVAFVDYSKEEKGLELGQGMLKRGTRVLLADEWIETGTQVCAAIQLIEAQGGVVAGVCAINIDENERTRRLRSQYRCCAALR